MLDTGGPDFPISSTLQPNTRKRYESQDEAALCGRICLMGGSARGGETVDVLYIILTTVTSGRSWDRAGGRGIGSSATPAEQTKGQLVWWHGKARQGRQADVIPRRGCVISGVVHGACDEWEKKLLSSKVFDALLALTRIDCRVTWIVMCWVAGETSVSRLSRTPCLPINPPC